MKKQTTNPMYQSYTLANLNEQIKLKGTVTLSQPIEMNAHDFLPNTSIFATTTDGELTDVINIKDCFNRLPQDEKLKVVSVLLEFCAMETNKLINQNK